MTHVVVCWLKKPGDAEARCKVMEASAVLRSIPGVLDVHAGTMIPSSRKTVDSSFDVALVIVLENEEVLRQYVTHPIHQKIVRETIQPLVRKYVAYDFRGE